MAIVDLWKSERGLIAVALILAATVLTALSVLTPERWDQWSTFVKWIFVTYTAGKTITGAVSLVTDAKKTNSSTDGKPALTPAEVTQPTGTTP
jgi:hypothetical protein